MVVPSALKRILVLATTLLFAAVAMSCAGESKPELKVPACDIILDQLRAANSATVETDLYERAKEAECLPTRVPTPRPPTPSCTELQAHEQDAIQRLSMAEQRQLSFSQEAAQRLRGVTPTEADWQEQVAGIQADLNLTRSAMQRRGCPSG